MTGNFRTLQNQNFWIKTCDLREQVNYELVAKGEIEKQLMFQCSKTVFFIKKPASLCLQVWKIENYRV